MVRRGDGFVKVVRPGRGAGIASASRVGSLLAEAAGLRAAQVLAAGDDHVVFETLPGRPVQDLWQDPSWQDLWQAWASAWSRFQSLGDVLDGSLDRAGVLDRSRLRDGRGADDGGRAADSGRDDGSPAADSGREDDVRSVLGGLTRHTPLHEAAVLRIWRDRAAAVGLLTGTSWLDRLTRTADRLERTADRPGSAAGSLRVPDLVPAHRDLHDGQLLWDGTRLALLDLDTVCLADPALDLANLAVHARLRRAQGLWSAAASSVVERAVAQVAGTRGVVERRLELARQATLARLVAVYAFRPPWRDVVPRWADDEWNRPLSSGDERTLISVSPSSRSGGADCRA